MDMRAIHDLAVEAAREAGAAIAGFYEDEYTVHYKSKDNPVTDADLAADRVIEDRLRHAVPDTGWLSEESVDDPARLDQGACWIVDPLDGTREFTRGVPEFVVSIAYVVGTEARIGVLFRGVRSRCDLGLDRIKR